MSFVGEIGLMLRGPLQVSVDFTNRCNLRCLHCFNRSGEERHYNLCKELDNRELMGIAEDIKVLQPPNVCICGGEPLLRREAVLMFLRALNDVPVKVSIVSNGWFFDSECADLLKESGLAALQFSVDGRDAVTHDKMRGVLGSHNRVVAAIKTARKAGFESLSVAFSPTRFNFRQFPDIVDWLVDIGVTNFRMQPLMGLGRGFLSPDIFMKSTEYLSLLHSIATLRIAYPRIKIEWGDPIDHLVRFAENPDFVPYLSVSSVGDICLSPYLPIILGSVRRHSLRDYWDAGIWKCWQIPLFRDIASFYASIRDFSRTDIPVPNATFSESVSFDIIDDSVVSLSSERMNMLYWSRFRECLARSPEGRLSAMERYVSLAQSHLTFAPSEVKRLADGGTDESGWMDNSDWSSYSVCVNGWIYDICSGSALRDIETFLLQMRMLKQRGTGKSELFWHMSPNFDCDKLCRSVLRMHIFNFSWLFFSVRSPAKGIVALGLVEVCNGFERGCAVGENAGVLQLLIGRVVDEVPSAEVCERLLRFIERNLWRASIIATPKLHVLMETPVCDPCPSFGDILCRRGFLREGASRYDEFALYSKFLV